MSLPTRRSWLLIGALATAVFSFVFLDVFTWAKLAQWREDQAFDIWIGYTRSIFEMPVGHRSSIGVPMPNGLMLAGKFFSQLPGLLWISTSLGLLQAACLFWLCRLITHRLGLAMLLFATIFSLPLFKGTTVEYGGTTLLILFHNFFMISVLYYLKRPHPRLIPAFIFLLVYTPSIYLSGIANSAAYLLIYAFILWQKPPRQPWRIWLIPCLISVVVIISAVWLCWIPYFKAALPEGIHPYHSDALLERVWKAYRQLVTFPLWMISQWVHSSFVFDWHFDGQIITRPAIRLTSFAVALFKTLSILSLTLIARHAIRRIRRSPALAQEYSEVHRFRRQVLWVGLSLILFIHVISPLLGGPELGDGEALQQKLQFIPLMVMLLFLAPFSFGLPRLAQRRVTLLVAALGILLFGTGITAGTLIAFTHLNYQGTILAECDVPLSDKTELVDFLGQHWKAQHNETGVAVDYDLAGRWGWVRQMGHAVEKWYPAPFTIGRALDYELLRKHGLHNLQEGIQERSIGKGAYLVSYSFLPSPHTQLSNKQEQEIKFGRLRLTIVSDAVTPTRTLATPSPSGNLTLSAPAMPDLVARSTPFRPDHSH